MPMKTFIQFYIMLDKFWGKWCRISEIVSDIFLSVDKSKGVEQIVFQSFFQSFFQMSETICSKWKMEKQNQKFLHAYPNILSISDGIFFRIWFTWYDWTSQFNCFDCKITFLFQDLFLCRDNDLTLIPIWLTETLILICNIQ